MFSIENRPKKWDEVAGQKNILKELKNYSLTSFPQAMLFEGASGIGKSTLAFIVAKVINCRNPIKKDDCIEPCNECDSCKDIDENHFNRDVHYFNCSNLGKEDIQKIEDIVNIYPFYEKNVVIILDEFQDLASLGAKRATLDLIEKPRKNVFFIGCTMEPEKIDKAIRTRCIPFKFKQLSMEDIGLYLIRLLEKNNIQYPEEFLTGGLLTIIENCEYSVRYAVQLLEKCVNGGYYTEKEILENLSIFSNDNLSKIINGLLSKDLNILKFLRSLEIKEIFYKILKVLQNSYYFKLTGDEDLFSDWEIKSYKMYISSKNFEKLFDIWSNIEDIPFFKERDFWRKLYYYYNNDSEKCNSEVSQVRNVRAVKL